MLIYISGEKALRLNGWKQRGQTFPIQKLGLKIFVQGGLKVIDEFSKYLCKYVEVKENTEEVQIYTLSNSGMCWCGFPPLYHCLIYIPNCNMVSLKSVALALWEASETLKLSKFKFEQVRGEDGTVTILLVKPLSAGEEEEYEKTITIAELKLSMRVYLASKDDDNLKRFLVCDFSKEVTDKGSFISLFVQRILSIAEEETAHDADTFRTIFVPKAGFLTSFAETWIRRK